MDETITLTAVWELKTYSISYNGIGKNEYTVTYSEDFSQSTYDWNNMLDSYSAYKTANNWSSYSSRIYKNQSCPTLTITAKYDVTSTTIFPLTFSSTSIYRADDNEEDFNNRRGVGVNGQLYVLVSPI